jgi:hypothetical protein
MKTIAARINMTGALLIGCVLSAHGQVHKCVINGQVEYQQEPCAANAKSSNVRYQSAPESTPTVKPAAGAPAPKVEPAAIAPQPKAEPQPPVKTGLERMADACFEWYRPMLRDPRSAYYRNPSFAPSIIGSNTGLLHLTIYATNGYGGYVDKHAVCEYSSGTLSQDWTQIQSKRSGW